MKMIKIWNIKINWLIPTALYKKKLILYFLSETSILMQISYDRKYFTINIHLLSS